MKRSDIENSLRSAVSSGPDISFEELAAMPYIVMKEHDYITKQETSVKPASIKRLSTILACCLLVFLSYSGWFISQRTSDSIVTFDVNPSIEIRMNHRNELLSVRAMNQDARTIVEGYSYKGKKYNEAVTYLMNSLVKHGYLNSDKTAILLTVINNNKEKANILMDRTESTIERSLSTNNIKPTIMKQVMSKEAERKKLAAKYQISEGKLRLIQAMTSLNNELTIDKLADMTVQQLLELADKYSMDLSSYHISKTQDDRKLDDARGEASEGKQNFGQNSTVQEQTRIKPTPKANLTDGGKLGKEPRNNQGGNWQKPGNGEKDDQNNQDDQKKKEYKGNIGRHDTENGDSDTGDESDYKHSTETDNENRTGNKQGSDDYSDNYNDNEDQNNQTAGSDTESEHNTYLIEGNQQGDNEDSDQNNDNKNYTDSWGNKYDIKDKTDNWNYDNED